MQVVTQDDPAADEGDIDTILHVGPTFNKPLEVQLDGKPLTMELDTGAAMSLVSEATNKNLFGEKALQQSKVKLHMYSGDPLRWLVRGKFSYGDQQAKLLLVVVEGNGVSLFRCSWLQHIRLNLAEIKAVRNGDLSGVLEQNAAMLN